MTAAESSFSLILDMFFGSPEPRLEAADNHMKIVNWQSETDVRRCLAQMAYVYGWSVEQEVVVPGWGRIDLVLRDSKSGPPILIELKLELKRPADVRRAFQQADGYGRWWKSAHAEAADVYLVANEIEMSVAAPVADAYPEVSLVDTVNLMGLLSEWRHPTSHRWFEAHKRLELARKMLAVYELAGQQIELNRTKLNSVFVDVHPEQVQEVDQ